MSFATQHGRWCDASWVITCSFLIVICLFTLTTGTSEVSSGDYGLYITNSEVRDEDGFDIDDSDYDIYMAEVSINVK